MLDLFPGRVRIRPGRAALAGVAILIFVAVRLLNIDGWLDQSELRLLLAAHPVSAIIAFIGVYASCTMVSLPTLPFNLLAGALWGALIGGLVSAVGASLGAIGAFLAIRLIFGQPLARRFDNRIVASLQRDFEKNGWRFIAFLRLNPVFPTGPLNYLLGLTSVGYAEYAIVTTVCLIFPSILVAWIGDELGVLTTSHDVSVALKSVLGLSAAVTLMVVLRYLIRLSRTPRAKGDDVG